MEIRNRNEIIGKNGIRIEIDFFQNGNNTASLPFLPLPISNLFLPFLSSPSYNGCGVW